MFYNNIIYKPIQFINNNIYIQNNTFFTKISSNQVYFFLTQLEKNNIFILKKSQTKLLKPISVPLVTRFVRLTQIPKDKAVLVLEKMILKLVNNFSYNILYFFIKQLFWLVPVPKHKQLLYFLRAWLKEISKYTNTFSGLFIGLRGKLAATGNKRKSAFYVTIGKGIASNLDNLQESNLRLLRTPTGVISVVSVVTYTR